MSAFFPERLKQLALIERSPSSFRLRSMSAFFPERLKATRWLSEAEAHFGFAQ